MNYERFRFLQLEWPAFYEIVQAVEESVIDNPGNALYKMNQLAELLVKEVAERSTNQKWDLEFKSLLDDTLKKGFMPVRFIQKIDEIRTASIKAFQTLDVDSLQVLSLYEAVFEWMAWFVSKFGERHYKDYLDGLHINDRVVLLESLLEVKYAADKHRETVAVQESDSTPPDIQLQKEEPPMTREDKITHFITLAKKGDVNAQYELANIYYDIYLEIGDKEFYDQADDLYKAAIKQNHIKAYIKVIYEHKIHDHSTYSNYAIDLKWLKHEAILGNIDAQFILGYIQLHGIGTTLNYNTAQKWLEMAVQNDYPEAYDILAKVYEYLGEKELAFHTLATAYEKGYKLRFTSYGKLCIKYAKNDQEIFKGLEILQLAKKDGENFGGLDSGHKALKTLSAEQDILKLIDILMDLYNGNELLGMIGILKNDGRYQSVTDKAIKYEKKYKKAKYDPSKKGTLNYYKFNKVHFRS